MGLVGHICDFLIQSPVMFTWTWIYLRFVLHWSYVIQTLILYLFAKWAQVHMDLFFKKKERGKLTLRIIVFHDWLIMWFIKNMRTQNWGNTNTVKRILHCSVTEWLCRSTLIYSVWIMYLHIYTIYLYIYTPLMKGTFKAAVWYW